MQETWVQSLDWEDSVKKGVANQYSRLENSREEEPGDHQSMVPRLPISPTVHGVAKNQIQLSD